MADASAPLGNPATFATTANIKENTDPVMAGIVYEFSGSPPQATQPVITK